MPLPCKLLNGRVGSLICASGNMAVVEIVSPGMVERVGFPLEALGHDGGFREYALPGLPVAAPPPRPEPRVRERRKPLLQLPFRLPWDAMARLMTAYATECRAITKRRGHPKDDGWRREAKRAEREAKVLMGLHEADQREPYPWPRDKPSTW